MTYLFLKLLFISRIYSSSVKFFFQIAPKILKFSNILIEKSTQKWNLCNSTSVLFKGQLCIFFTLKQIML